MGEKLCYVYAVGHVRGGQPSGPVKFGMSDQPFARLRELQTGNPHQLCMLGMLAAPSRTLAREWEQFIHYCHPDKAMSGEWFDMDAWQGVETLGYFIHDKSSELNGRGEVFPETEGPAQ